MKFREFAHSLFVESLCIPTVDDNGIGLQNDYIETKIIAAFSRRLEAQREQNEEFSNVMGIVKSVIDSVKDAATANEACEVLKGLEHVGNSRVMASRMLADKTKSLNLTYNKEAGRYE